MKKIIVTLMISIMAFSACSSLSSKPSKQDVKDGYYKMVTKSDRGADIDKDSVKKATDCIIDEIYGDLSKAGAKVFAEGDEKGKGTQKDLDLLSDASKTCGDKLANK